VPKKRFEFPYLWGTHDELMELEKRDDKGGRTIIPCAQGRAEVQFYKGSVLLIVFDGNQKEVCAAAWLNGDALDVLQKDVRVRRRQWHQAYARARRKVVAELKTTPKENPWGGVVMTPDARGLTPGGQRLRKEMGKSARHRSAKKKK